MAFAILFAIVSALIIGGLAGYWLKGLSAQVAAPVTAATVSKAAVQTFAVPASLAARSVQQHPAPGALKAAGDDTAPVVSSSPSIINSDWLRAHRRGGLQDPRY
jgi:hypothetical protein